MKLCLDIDYRVNRINSMKNINDKGMILFIVGNKMFVVGKNSMMGGLPYDYCKLNSVVTESTKNKTGPYSDEISFEYIKEKNPDYILVINKDAALRLDSAKNKSFLMNNPLLQDVTAIKNNRVEFVNSEVWYLAGGGYTSSNIMMDEIINIMDENYFYEDCINIINNKYRDSNGNLTDLEAIKKYLKTAVSQEVTNLHKGKSDEYIKAKYIDLYTAILTTVGVK